jgi:hypothetical protein
MYDKELTEASKGALVELMLSLGSYHDDCVLVGGWPPYFLTSGNFDHCGSIDIDLVLWPSIMKKYQGIREIVEGLGYKDTANIFRFERDCESINTKRKFQMHLDFLTEPDAAQVLPRAQLIEVQKDLNACLIKGISIVFDFNYNQTIKAVIPGNGEAECNVLTSNIVSSLTTKGQAITSRVKDKDYYDIYAVTGFHNGDPKNAAEAYCRLLGNKTLNAQNPFIISSLTNISKTFEKVSSIGPSMVSRFINGDLTTDAFERVNAFLAKVQHDLGVKL